VNLKEGGCGGGVLRSYAGGVWFKVRRRVWRARGGRWEFFRAPGGGEEGRGGSGVDIRSGNPDGIGGGQSGRVPVRGGLRSVGSGPG